jgi:uncharacterized protein (DUF2249 family)
MPPFLWLAFPLSATSVTAPADKHRYSNKTELVFLLSFLKNERKVLMMSVSPLMLDVRSDLAQGQDPFVKIMQAVGQLRAGQELLLVAPFEPTPLYRALEQRGFVHHTEQAAPDEWRVTFHPIPDATSEQAARQQPDILRPMAPPGMETSPVQHTTHLDTRGMDPPGPLVRILTTLETLGDGQSLVAHIDREPLLLFPELIERGWAYEGTPQPDGSFLIRIFRPVPERELL